MNVYIVIFSSIYIYIYIYIYICIYIYIYIFIFIYLYIYYICIDIYICSATAGPTQRQTDAKRLYADELKQVHVYIDEDR